MMIRMCYNNHTMSGVRYGKERTINKANREIEATKS